MNLMKAQFTYWKESDGWYLGYLNDYPDHWAQAPEPHQLFRVVRGGVRDWERR